MRMTIEQMKQIRELLNKFLDETQAIGGGDDPDRRQFTYKAECYRTLLTSRIEASEYFSKHGKKFGREK